MICQQVDCSQKPGTLVPVQFITVEDPTWTSQVDKFSDQIDDKIRTILIASKPIEQAPLTDLAQLQEFEFSMQGWLSDEDLQAYPNIYHGLQKDDNVA